MTGKTKLAQDIQAEMRSRLDASRLLDSFNPRLPLPQDPEPAMPQPPDDTTVRLPRVTLDLKVPIWAVGSAVAGLVWALMSMWFQLVNQSQALAEMQALLKANNQTAVQMQIEMALMKQRVEKLELHK